jgi:hypothetical protein
MENPEQYIQISTKFRTNPDDKPSDCKIEMKRILRAGTYRLVYCLFPNTFFTINDNNDKIYLEDQGFPVVTCTLTHGFFDYRDFPEVVQAALNEASPRANNVVNPETYTVAYSDTTRKLSITTINNFRLVFSGKENTCHELIGFNRSDTSLDTRHESTGLVNLDPIHCVNISVDQITSVSQQTLHGTTFIIPIPAGIYNYVNYISDPEWRQTMFVHTDKRIINITLKDEYGKLIDTNGTDWMMILEKL